MAKLSKRPPKRLTITVDLADPPISQSQAQDYVDQWLVVEGGADWAMLETLEVNVHRIPEWNQQIVAWASLIGMAIEQRHPADKSLGYPTIPDNGVEDIGAVITLVVAQILQAWLDAGSERDVTIEALNEVIENHVAEWSTSSAKA